ncbi:lysozyme inhibitor LprI family protein, partial [Roseomonas mucosa]
IMAPAFLRLLLPLLCLVLSALPSPKAKAASFDCAKAGSAVERMICRDSGLSSLDEEMAAAFRAAGGGGVPELRAGQREWLAERNRCRTESCLRTAYEQRVATLSAIPEAREASPAPAAPAAPAGVAGDGKYCNFGPGESSDMLLVRRAAGGGLNFVLSSWTSRGSNFSVEGLARPAASPGALSPDASWRFESGMRSRDPVEHCAVTIRRTAEGAYAVATEEGARCESMAGQGAVLYGTLVFPPNSRQGNAPATMGPETSMRIGCDRPARRVPSRR